MQLTRTTTLGLVLATILAACAGTGPGRPVSDEGTLSHVLLDGKYPAYTVVMGVPINATPDQWAKVRQTKGSSSKVELVEWKTFLPEAETRLTAMIVKDEYGMSSRLGDFIFVVQNYPGAPFGLTWNGGMAFTFRDYEHTKKLYAQYKADPGSWRSRGGRSKREDPVHPDNHLPFFLVPRAEQGKPAASP
ncbi:MAG: hypothetical protein ACYTGZ_13400 [Planctomycetota bacterium]|jgi:hypothetical protein